MDSIDFSHLKLREKVGAGSFGTVWEATYLGTPVAVKECVPSPDDTTAEFTSYFEREVELLRSRHPNIVQFLGTCVHAERFWLVTEYIPCGTMKSWIISGKAAAFRTRLSFAIDIARALTYLHAYNIIHRDLKPSNLLITESKRVKVCDFGFARLLSQTDEERKRMSYCGTDEYMAPELLQGKPFDASVDVFGFGVILCELAACQVANSRVFPRAMPGYFIRPEEVKSRATPDCPTRLVDLALKCVNVEPALRPTMVEVLDELHGLELAISALPTPISFTHPKEKPQQTYLPPLLEIKIPDSNISFRLGKDSVKRVDISRSDPSVCSFELQLAQPCSRVSSITTFKSLLADSPGDFMGTVGRAATPMADVTLSLASFFSLDSAREKHEGLGSRPALLLETKGNHGHRFSIKEANGHELCLHCHQRLSDFLVLTYAMACEDCGFLCHKRCAPITPLNCEAPSSALKALKTLLHDQSTLS